MSGEPSGRERRMWQVLVGIQLAAAGAVAAAVFVVWLISQVGGDFGSR
jgi:hypothetical protein